MADVDPKIDDPLGDIAMIVKASERLATAVTDGQSKTPAQRRAMYEDARTILSVASRLRGRL